MQWCRELYMGALRYPGLRGSRHFAPGTWQHENHPLPYEVTSPWTIAKTNRNSDNFHDDKLLLRLCEEVKGFFYYCVEVADNPNAIMVRPAFKAGKDGFQPDTYRWRFHLRFANKDEALLFKLATIFDSKG